MAVDNWLEDRPTMMRSNFADASVVHLFCEEVGEFCEATTGKTVEEMKTSTEVREELGDLILFLLSIFKMLGMCPTEVGMEKMSINMLRYPAYSYQEGDFQTKHGWNREWAKKTKVKEWFYAQVA